MDQVHGKEVAESLNEISSTRGGRRKKSINRIYDQIKRQLFMLYGGIYQTEQTESGTVAHGNQSASNLFS